MPRSKINAIMPRVISSDYGNIAVGKICEPQTTLRVASAPEETLASKRQRQLDGAEDCFAQRPGTISSGARISGSHSLICVRNRPSSLEPNTPHRIAYSGTGEVLSL